METETSTVASESHAKTNNKPEMKEVRIPLALFENKTYLAMLPESVQKKAEKIGIKIAGGRKWGPLISVSQKDGSEMFRVAESLYRSPDKSIPKNIKTFGYQLRKSVAKEFGFAIVNVREYVRKPKAAPEPVQAAAPVVQEQHMAASMPPRANLDRANAILDSVMEILRDNGQPGAAALVNQAKVEITIPEVEHA